MRIKEINFSDYTYKRVCVYEANQTFYPAGQEALLVAKHGEKELENAPETDEYGWLVLTVKGAALNN
ncbi:MAG: hypothetical protein IKM00_00435 [Clostridia bacterium]|nr:hypothetical protein [Clostridia bacterium]MBR6743671.1 hypothetical protein [Clostridia bacterium]